MYRILILCFPLALVPLYTLQGDARVVDATRLVLGRILWRRAEVEAIEGVNLFLVEKVGAWC